MECGQIVVFKLVNYKFGVNIMNVLEIQNYEPIRPLPDAPKYISGIINVRGTVFTIIDLRKRLNMQEQEEINGSKIILMNLKEYRVGFLVDSVCEIFEVVKEELEAPPAITEKNQTSCIESILKKNEEMIILLNVDILISEKENVILQGVQDEENCGSNPK